MRFETSILDEEPFDIITLTADWGNKEVVDLLGLLPTAELINVLSLSDLHIYLTVPFVLSWSLINALACGCTVLASDTPPVREVITHGHNGLLAGFSDEASLLRESLKVLDAPQNYRVLGQAGRATVEERYSNDVCLPRLKELCQRVAHR